MLLRLEAGLLFDHLLLHLMDGHRTSSTMSSSAYQSLETTKRYPSAMDGIWRPWETESPQLLSGRPTGSTASRLSSPTYQEQALTRQDSQPTDHFHWGLPLTPEILSKLETQSQVSQPSQSQDVQQKQFSTLDKVIDMYQERHNILDQSEEILSPSTSSIHVPCINLTHSTEDQLLNRDRPTPMHQSPVSMDQQQTLPPGTASLDQSTCTQPSAECRVSSLQSSTKLTLPLRGYRGELSYSTHSPRKQAVWWALTIWTQKMPLRILKRGLEMMHWKKWLTYALIGPPCKHDRTLHRHCCVRLDRSRDRRVFLWCLAEHWVQPVRQGQLHSSLNESIRRYLNYCLKGQEPEYQLGQLGFSLTDTKTKNKSITSSIMERILKGGDQGRRRVLASAYPSCIATITRLMQDRPPRQHKTWSLYISGESGLGKTTTVKVTLNVCVCVCVCMSSEMEFTPRLGPVLFKLLESEALTWLNNTFLGHLATPWLVQPSLVCLYCMPNQSAVKSRPT